MYLIRIVLLIIALDFPFHLFAQTSTLAQTIAHTRANHPRLAQEKLQIAITQTDTITARLRPNPKLNNQSLFFMDSRRFLPNTHFLGARNNQIWWQLTKEFELPNFRKARLNLARQTIQTEQKRYLQTEYDLCSQAAELWLDLWTIQNQYKVLQLAKNNADTLVAINQVRLKNQVITPVELMRVQMLAEQYALELATKNQEFKNATLQLALFLNLKQEEISIDTKEDLNLKTIPQNQDSLLQLAFKNRMELQVLDKELLENQANIQFQKLKVLPRPELGFIYNPQNSLPYFGVFGTIELPFFNRNQGEIARAKLETIQSQEKSQWIKKQIQTEIATAFQTYQLYSNNLNKYNKLISQSEEILQTVQYSYTKGGTTILDLLDAQRSWLDTRQLYYIALSEYYKTYIKVAIAAGILFDL